MIAAFKLKLNKILILFVTSFLCCAAEERSSDNTEESAENGRKEPVLKAPPRKNDGPHAK